MRNNFRLSPRLSFVRFRFLFRFFLAVGFKHAKKSKLFRIIRKN